MQTQRPMPRLTELGYPVVEENLHHRIFGKEKPKAEGNNEAAWAENRRADIIYLTN